MRRRWGRALLCLLAVLQLPLALVLSAFALPAQYMETFLGGYSDKLNTLNRAPGRRIILTGGSGAAFAVRSDLLEQELPGYSVVNMGMYAGLGSMVPLDAALTSLREGDVVVFMPEQSRQTLSDYFGAESMWQAADGHWAMLGNLRHDHWRAMLGELPYFAAKKARCFLEGSMPQGEGVYCRGAFNDWGDIRSELRSANTMSDGFDRSTGVAFDEDLPGQAFLDRVNDAARRCSLVGAELFFAFCPMNERAVASDAAASMMAYEQRVRDSLCCPVLGTLQNSVMDAEWFFDSNFHLNGAGATAYTAQLARDIQDALGWQQQVSITIPDKPGLVTAHAVAGDNSDAALFSYVPVADGVRIAALKEQGRARTSIIVPAVWNGMPVTGFEASVFAENTVIESITIQGNIRSIDDGSFIGCTELTRLEMQEVAPSACTVGQGLLEGCRANIYVEKESMSAYQTSYFWSVHAARIRAKGHSGKRVSAENTHVPQNARTEQDALGIIYDGNGGVFFGESGKTRVERPVSSTHLRTNTLLGTDCLIRPGYVQIAWNTAADGSGERIGLGSRFRAEPGMTLYAQWAAISPAEDFSWRVEDGAALITEYHGEGGLCVIPMAYQGLPVRRICERAFEGARIDTVVLSPNLRWIEAGAFAGSSVKTVILYDSLARICDESFSGCKALQTLCVNASTAPVYSVSYYATFADKYDWLLSLNGQRKLVLFSGSSTRYGYDSERLHAAFPAWQVANMGVYAYSNALPQAELILQAMEPGDVLLHAPEFDTLHTQFFEEAALDMGFWAMMEADYDAAALLDLRHYSRVWDSLSKYLAARKGMTALNPELSPNGYDDDGNVYGYATYNRYGDLTLPREGSREETLLQHMRAEYTVGPFGQERLEALNSMYRRFLARGVQVLFTYSPRNRESLTESSTPENRSALENLLRETLCVPVISPMEDALMPARYFYLIDSHLSTEGVKVHTEQIIADLAPYLGGEGRSQQGHIADAIHASE